MAFDPFSWAVGWSLSKAAQKGLDATFSPSLGSTLADEVRNWSRAHSELSDFVPEALFAEGTVAEKGKVVGPAVTELRARLNSLDLPTQAEWLAALVERWRSVHRAVGSQAQAFFRLPPKKAQPLLEELAQRMHRRCSQDAKLALPHMVNALDRIEVTLSEMKQLHALRVLQAVPVHGLPENDAVRRVTGAARRAAGRHGWGSSIEMHVVYGERLEATLVFPNANGTQVLGSITIDSQRLAMWLRLEESLLEAAVSGVMFDVPLFTGIDQSWNSMVQFIGDTSRTLYPDSVRAGHFGISARYDLKRIGVPVPITHRTDLKNERIVMMTLGVDAAVPFLTFGPELLQELVGLPEARAAGCVATWLQSEWGLPSVLKV